MHYHFPQHDDLGDIKITLDDFYRVSSNTGLHYNVHPVWTIPLQVLVHGTHPSEMTSQTQSISEVSDMTSPINYVTPPSNRRQ